MLDYFKLGAGVFAILLVLAGVIGWVWNIVKIFGLWGAAITAELVVRLVGGIVPPLGAIVGYF